MHASFHAMAKPSGPDCNLGCAYCFYLEKAAIYPQKNPHRMSDAVLEAYVREYIAATPKERKVEFTWQGGEPTLLGLNFYRRAVALQRRHGQGRRIANSFQTNGLLLDENWCSFFAEHDFLIGLSLDGPADIHDEYRRTKSGQPSHALVMRALELLRRHGVRHNALACVNRRSSREPLRVYEFLRAAGLEFIQFIPIVERLPDTQDTKAGLALHSPGESGPDARLTEWSVLPRDYGCFLTAIFDAWLKRDVGKTYVMNFEWALANFMGEPGAACHHQPVCGNAVVVEHNGDVYSCDHYVYPDYLLGNIQERTFSDMLASSRQESFGVNKHSSLPAQCRECAMLRGCWGGCPKHRFAATTDQGESSLNYLCEGYYHFFSHTAPRLKAISGLIKEGRPASDIMKYQLVFMSKPSTP